MEISSNEHNIHSKAFIKCLRGENKGEKKIVNRKKASEMSFENIIRSGWLHFIEQKIMRLISFRAEACLFLTHFVHSFRSSSTEELSDGAAVYKRFAFKLPCLTSIRMIGSGSGKRKKNIKLIHTYTHTNEFAHTHTMHSHSNKRR